MANSIDTVLESLRQLSGGAAQFAKNREGRLDREAAYGAKRDQAEAERKRLEAAGLEAAAIAKEFEADPENFDTKKLAKVSTNFRKVAGGDASLNAMIDDFRSAAENVEKNKRTTATATASAVKADKKADADKVVADSKLRDEERGIKKTHYDKSERTRAIETSYNDITKLLENPKESEAADNLAVTLLAKAADPTTGVKQEEFKTYADGKAWFERTFSVDEKTGEATSATGTVLPAAIAGIFRKANPDKRGSYLSPSQREAIKDAMGDLYESQLIRQQDIDNETFSDVDRTPQADRKRVVGTPAEEKLKAYRTKKEERRRKKEEADKVSLTPGDGKKKSTAKVMDEKSFQEFFEMNKPAVTAAFQAAEQRLGRPLTPQEKQTQINALIKAADVQTAPKGK